MSPTTTPLISIVVPAFNEEEVLAEFHQRLTKVLNGMHFDFEIVYVNDGSSDNTLSILHQFHSQDDSVSLVDLSRNFGKEIALTAGLHKATGDAIIVIDADLQDPPELIPQLVDEWQNGNDVVYAKRMRRGGETVFKKTTAFFFYRLIRKISHVKIPEDTGDYRLLSRRAVNALNELPEHHRFMKGLFTWIGYKQKAVLYERDPRMMGKTKWNYWHLWNFALEGITSFTTVPLRLATYIGFITAFGSFIYGIFFLAKTLIYSNPVPGYPSLIIIILFLGGIQLMSIGVLGEYIGRIFNETKHRPLYFLNDYLPRRKSSHNENSNEE